jgi:hypothetical protein
VVSQIARTNADFQCNLLGRDVLDTLLVEQIDAGAEDFFFWCAPKRGSQRQALFF